MNCKPGDLALVVKHHRPDTAWTLGLVVTVGKPSPVHASAWTTDPTLIDPVDGRPVHFYDHSLRPIRPGDISDEEVRDLYAPDRSMKDSPPSDTTSPSEKKEAA